MFKKIKPWIKNEWSDTKLLLKNIPATAVTLFVVAVVAMNLLASKLIVDTSWLSLDAGIIVAWLPFLAMDMIVKRFGPKASIKVTILAILVNVLVMAIFSVAALIPGDWCLNDYATSFNWWIIAASTTAFIISGIVNSVVHWLIKKTFKKQDSFLAYACSSYGSTMLGQFVDNFIFGLIFTFPAFGITPLALFMFAFTGAVVELLCQIIFSPIGFKIAERWRINKVGEEYLTRNLTVTAADIVDIRDKE